MLQSLLKADKMLGTSKAKAPVKAADSIKSLADKARASGEKKLEKYLNSKDAIKSISNKIQDAFDDVASDYGYEFKFESLEVDGGKFGGSLDSEDTLAEYELNATLTFKWEDDDPENTDSIDDIAERLELMRNDFYDAAVNDGHLPLQGYSPVSETELRAIVADIEELDELPPADKFEDEGAIDEVKLVFADFARGNLNKLIEFEGDGEYSIPLAIIMSWELYLG